MEVLTGFPYYVSLTGTEDLKRLFEAPGNFQLLSSLAEEKAAYRYMPGKWSMKQIVGHITDHERIMIYRVLRFSRKDTTVLPGYDQDQLTNNARFDMISWKDLLRDFSNVRKSTLSFIESLSEDQLRLKGIASNFEMSVEEFLRATIGHEMHHMRIIKERYL